MTITIKHKRLKILKYIAIIVGVIMAIWLIQILLVSTSNQENVPTAQNKTNIQGHVDKIQVVHFHATQQCWSCITVGEYAEETIKERFPNEFEEGKIEFLDINGELPQNMELVNKYGAVGSSLFVNVITEGEDNISEDIEVWRLVANESKFKNYFENKLNNYLY